MHLISCLSCQTVNLTVELSDLLKQHVAELLCPQALLPEVRRWAHQTINFMLDAAVARASTEGLCACRAPALEAPKESMLASVFGNLRQSIFAALEGKDQV